MARINECIHIKFPILTHLIYGSRLEITNIKFSSTFELNDLRVYLSYDKLNRISRVKLFFKEGSTQYP